jgi:outer membrane protein TolC
MALASGITAPLLNFGRLQGAIDTSDARANAASLSYQNASLTALQETKSALSDYLNGISAADEQKRALDHRKDTVILASERFKRGLTDMTDVTTAQSELNQATLLYIDRKTAAAIAYVRLNKALGTSVSGKTTINSGEAIDAE